MESIQIFLKLDGLFKAEVNVQAKTIQFILNLESWQNLIKNRSHKNYLTWAKNKTQTAVTNICLNCITFTDKLNVSYVTTYIIRSDYYSVTDKFKFKNTTVRTGN